MLIRNFKSLANSSLREAALKIVNSGLESIVTNKVISQNVRLRGNFLFIQDKSYDLSHYRKVFLLAFGKNAFAASESISKILDSKLNSGIVLGQSGGRLPKLSVYKCTHPNTTQQNVSSTKKVMEFLRQTTDDDLLIVVVSGGGSAMLSAPYKINAKKKSAVAEVLMDGGANIEELNTVRKHLSEIKGGRLAKLAYPSTIAALVFSDVIGNDLSVIASGPMVLDHSTVTDAEKILDKYQVLKKLRLKKLELTESPKERKLFQKVEHFLLLDNKVALEAMAQEAGNLGFKPKVFSEKVGGYAPETGRFLLSQAKAGEAFLAAGETTVRVKGNGVGGRNQEMVLANLEYIKENQVFISVGSDGHDHSDFAGAIGDKTTLQRALKKKISPKSYSENSDSFNFFREIGDGIDTGKLESNVADLMLVLTGKG